MGQIFVTLLTAAQSILMSLEAMTMQLSTIFRFYRWGDRGDRRMEGWWRFAGKERGGWIVNN